MYLVSFLILVLVKLIICAVYDLLLLLILLLLLLMTEDFAVKVPQYLQTLGVQQRHRGPWLETPQRLNAVALLQVQQLDQDNRVDLQQAAVSWTSSTGGDGRSSGSTSSSGSSSTTTM